MDFRDISELCESRQATPDEIQEYLNEKDDERRINLAYEYQISKEYLYVEDYNAIMRDVHNSLQDFQD